MNVMIVQFCKTTNNSYFTYRMLFNNGTMVIVLGPIGCSLPTPDLHYSLLQEKKTKNVMQFFFSFAYLITDMYLSVVYIY